MGSGQSRHNNQAKQARREKRKQKNRSKRVVQSAPKTPTWSGYIEDNQCVLPLSISHPSHPLQRRKVRAIIDTGATGSAIKPELVKALGLPVVNVMKCNTASGTIDSPVVLVLLEVEHGGTKHQKLIQAGVPNGLTDDMLFGMDAMRGGVLTVDTMTNKWSWKLTR